MDRWQQVTRTFQAALARDPRERAAFLAVACGGDEELRREVESLLRARGAAAGVPGVPGTEASGAVSTGTMTGPPIGRRLAHYAIAGRIGAGGMGEVYRARDERLDRDVAIKLLPAASYGDPTARARLLREARAAAALNHPHICTIHEVGEADGQTYIAMELVEGQPLNVRLAAGALSVGEALRYGLQLADALAHAHQRGVLHRDLKSANIIITPDARVKVLDFGLAKRLSSEALSAATTQSHALLTQPGEVMGTLAYMAPEQLRGQPADARSDVWALGVVLYEMAAGVRPFRGQTGFELSSAILSQPRPPLSPQVPAPLRAIIDRCLAREPRERYQDGSDVSAPLKAMHSGAAPAAWPLVQPGLSRRRWLTLAAGLALVLVGTAALDIGGVRGRLLGPLATPRFTSLAVLPFANLSGDPEQEYFSDGMTEALITDLAKIGALGVISRTSAMSYKGTDKPLREIGRELGVDVVIEGSAQRVGDRVRITAQLIDAATDRHLWAETYERSVTDVVRLQRDVARAIAREINVQLTPLEEAHLAAARTVNPEAYEAFLRGMFFVNRLTPEDFEKGLALLHQAAETDPGEPLAYAGLAQAYSLIGSHSPEPPPDALERAEAAALQALDLDDMLAEAHAVLAQIKLYREWDWPGAEQAFRRALDISPSLAPAHAHYAFYLNLFGRQEDALAQMRRAQQVDPLEPLWATWLGDLHWTAGQYDSAIEEFHKALELAPEFPWAHWMLGMSYAEKGMYQEAIIAHQQAVAANPAWRWALGYTYARAGRAEEARRIAAEVEEGAGPPEALGLAAIYAALGEKDEAFRWLQVGHEHRLPHMPWLKVPPFASLRDDPRFQDLLRRMNLPAQ